MRLKKAISWLLSAAMVLSMTSLPASVKAADTEADHQLESPQYIVNITGTDLVKAGMDETKVQATVARGTPHFMYIWERQMLIPGCSPGADLSMHLIRIIWMQTIMLREPPERVLPTSI